MPAHVVQPTLEDTRAVASILFHQFARDRFLQAGLEEPIPPTIDAGDPANIDPYADDVFHAHTDHHNNNDEHDHGDSNYCSSSRHQEEDHEVRSQTRDMMSSALSTPVLASYGRELRRIAEQFEQTRMRQEIRNQAGQVRLTDIHRESFTKLLEQLFQGGITRERVAILFFFCTDVALNAVSIGPALVSKLLSWSLGYIRDRVCQWIYDHGGWDVVLNRYVPSVLVTACAMLGIVAFAIYIRKNIWT